MAVVPDSTGDNFAGKIGKDYLDTATESQIEYGEQAAEWLVKTLGGKGNIIMLGGTPGNPMTAAQTVGWRRAFAKYPGIKIVGTPGPRNAGSESVAQQKTRASPDPLMACPRNRHADRALLRRSRYRGLGRNPQMDPALTPGDTTSSENRQIDVVRTLEAFRSRRRTFLKIFGVIACAGNIALAFRWSRMAEFLKVWY